LQLDLLARRAEDGTPRRRVLPEGWMPVPPGLLDDVHRGRLEPLDLAVLLTFALTLQTRQVHPAYERHVRFDGDALVVDDRAHQLLEWDPGARQISQRVMHAGLEQALQRLAARGWLEVEPMERGAVRVRLGARMSPNARRPAGVRGPSLATGSRARVVANT
jgi:hypothetical protein